MNMQVTEWSKNFKNWSMTGVHKLWLNTGLCNTTWNEWQIICACIGSQKRQKKKERRKASSRWIALKDSTWITNESQILGLSYRKKGKEGGPIYSKYLPLTIVTHFMFLMFALSEACLGFRKFKDGCTYYQIRLIPGTCPYRYSPTLRLWCSGRGSVFLRVLQFKDGCSHYQIRSFLVLAVPIVSHFMF
jgi:hypothetical protein